MKREVKKCDGNDKRKKRGHNRRGRGNHNNNMEFKKEQHVIALSSTESEYITQMHAAKEALWIRSFIIEIQGQQLGAIELHCDNQGVIVLAKDNKFHSCTKHINL